MFLTVLSQTIPVRAKTYSVRIVVCLYTDDCSDYTGTVMDDIAVLKQLVCCMGPQFGLFFFFGLI